jgi:hypothetical protein
MNDEQPNSLINENKFIHDMISKIKKEMAEHPDSLESKFWRGEL